MRTHAQMTFSLARVVAKRKKDFPMVSLDHFRQVLHDQLANATTRGATHIIVNAGELTIAVSRHPTADDLERCKEAMQRAMVAGDTIVEDGEGRLTSRYALPRL
jgi:hypothetical protein